MQSVQISFVRNVLKSSNICKHTNLVVDKCLRLSYISSSVGCCNTQMTLFFKLPRCHLLSYTPVLAVVVLPGYQWLSWFSYYPGSSGCLTPQCQWMLLYYPDAEGCLTTQVLLVVIPPNWHWLQYYNTTQVLVVVIFRRCW